MTVHNVLDLLKGPSSVALTTTLCDVYSQTTTHPLTHALSLCLYRALFPNIRKHAIINSILVNTWFAFPPNTAILRARFFRQKKNDSKHRITHGGWWCCHTAVCSGRSLYRSSLHFEHMMVVTRMHPSSASDDDGLDRRKQHSNTRSHFEPDLSQGGLLMQYASHTHKSHLQMGSQYRSLCGWRKIFFFYTAEWANKPMLHISPKFMW